jgi:type II secretory pathway pseudopilin PulG
MLRALIGTTIVAGAVLAVGASHGSAVALTGTKAPTSPSTVTLTTTNPSFGGTASFAVVDPPTKSLQEIGLTCTENGQTVYLSANTQNEPSWTQFKLWSQEWSVAGGGSANCVAQLYYFTWQGKTETGVVIEDQTTFTTG